MKEKANYIVDKVIQMRNDTSGKNRQKNHHEIYIEIIMIKK